MQRMKKKQAQWTISAECGINAGDLAHAQALADEVKRTDGIELKIDWEFAAEQGLSQPNSFCCRNAGLLVGYAFLEGNDTELEMTAAVSPAFRRQGILTSLLRAVQAEARKREVGRLLAVSYRASASGTAAMQALGLPYVFSEYRMEAEAGNMPPLPAGMISLVRVSLEEAADLARMTALVFGSGQSSSDTLLARLMQEGSRYFFAELNGVRIGQIGVAETKDSLYIRGVGILPKYRRRGYGRQLLAAVLRQMLLEKHTKFLLDVATDNPQALSLYHSGGFRETAIYDYYDVLSTRFA